MIKTVTTTKSERLTKADNVNTYTANNDGLTTISSSSHVVTGGKAKSRVRGNTGARTSVQRAKDRNRWLDSLYNNYSDHGVDSLRCSFFTGRFDSETKSVQVAQNRVSRWLDSLPFKVESWTSVIEHDAGGTVHCHVILKADKSVLNHGVNHLHNVLIETFKAFGTGHSQRIYNLENLGFYMMLSQTNKAKTVKQAVKDEQQAKSNYDTVKSLNVPANIKKQAKKEWRKSHMDKKKAVAKAYEKRSDKVMRKSYGQKHGISVRTQRADVWDFITTHGIHQQSSITRITAIDEWGNEHLINVVKRDVYRLNNDTDVRALQHMLGAIKAYQDNTAKAVA